MSALTVTGALAVTGTLAVAGALAVTRTLSVSGALAVTRTPVPGCAVQAILLLAVTVLFLRAGSLLC